jgi:hypothetical protein
MFLEVTNTHANEEVVIRLDYIDEIMPEVGNRGTVLIKSDPVGQPNLVYTTKKNIEHIKEKMRECSIL